MLLRNVLGLCLCLIAALSLLGCEPKESEWETSQYRESETASDRVTTVETEEEGNSEAVTDGKTEGEGNGDSVTESEPEADSETESNTEAVWSPFL